MPDAVLVRYSAEWGAVSIIVGLMLAMAVTAMAVAVRARKLRVGRVYRLTGMTPEMWQVGHPRYGTPSVLVGWLIGIGRGTRQWFLFEIQKSGKDGIRREIGTLQMPLEDLNRLTVEDLGPYHAPEG
jgi:hypothetical protein